VGQQDFVGALLGCWVQWVMRLWGFQFVFPVGVWFASAGLLAVGVGDFLVGWVPCG
jgi:hypothetical protein